MDRRIFLEPLSKPKLTSLHPALAIFLTISSSILQGYRIQRQEMLSQEITNLSQIALA